jgi:hypothetical protein
MAGTTTLTYTNHSRASNDVEMKQMAQFGASKFTRTSLNVLFRFPPTYKTLRNWPHEFLPLRLANYLNHQSPLYSDSMTCHLLRISKSQDSRPLVSPLCHLQNLQARVYMSTAFDFRSIYKFVNTPKQSPFLRLS